MIKEGYNEKLIFKPILMNKKILRNFEYLQNLSRRAKGEARVKADRLMDLYISLDRFHSYKRQRMPYLV